MIGLKNYSFLKEILQLIHLIFLFQEKFAFERDFLINLIFNTLLKLNSFGKFIFD